MLVDFAHEALHEDDLRQTDGQRAKIARERVHVVEIVQLHRVREVEDQILQILTPANTHHRKHTHLI